MNILPKKSWHVRTRKNIERVQRDEAEASKKAHIELDRRLRVEQELRLKELRTRAGLTTTSDDLTHFNLFDEVKNPEISESSEGEKQLIERAKLDADKWQDRLGLSGKLVKDDVVTQPWYCKTTKRQTNSQQSSHTNSRRNCDKDITMSSIYTNNTELNPRKKPKSDQIKSIYDPMIAMNQANELCRAIRNKNNKVNITNHNNRARFTINELVDHDRDRSSSPEIIDVIPSKCSKA